MRNIILIVLLLLSIAAVHVDITPYIPQDGIVVENDVIYGNNLPSRATTCKETRVHSAPADFAPILYTLPVGKVVKPMEKSNGKNLGWIMIKPAEWVRGLDLCPRGE